ncbi:MAG: TonB-dependent receptor [Nitrospirales bacterium]|nr:TonB-dependent receptor [Nitrospirales bacterium]
MKRIAFAFFAIIATFSLSYGEGLMLHEIEVKSQKESSFDSLEIREVRETDAKDLGEALEAIDGLSKVRKGGIANDIVLRGFQQDNINVLVDGMKVYGACPNRMDPPSFHLDFAEVDRVDILKGPYDVTNAGSLGGTVEISTKSARPGFHGEADLGYGSFNSFSGSALLSYGTDTFSILGGAAYKYSEPYEDGHGARFTEIYPSTSANRYRESEKDGTAYDIETGWLKTGFSPLANHHAEISYTRQAADDILYPYLLMDAVYDDTDRLNFTYRIEKISPVIQELKLQTYWSQVKHLMTDEKRCSSSMNPMACSGSLPLPYSMSTLAETGTWGGRIEGQLSVWGKTRIGLDYSLRNWDNSTTMFNRMTMVYNAQQDSVPDVDTRNIGIYLEQKNELAPKVKLTVGLRLDSTETEAGKDRTAVYNLYYPGSSLSETDTYPSGNIQLRYDPTDSLGLFLGYGHSVRVPDPRERYFALQKMGTMMMPDWVGNPGLDPVTNDELDLGLKYSADTLLIKGSLFYSSLNDFIVLRDITNGARFAKSYRNIDASIFGGEASARIALPSDLYLFTGIAYTRGKNNTEHTNLPEIPPFSGQLGLRYDNDRFFAEIEGVFASTQNKVDERLNEQQTSGWVIANLKLGYTCKGLKLFAGVRNLFDKFYYEHLSYNRDPFSSGIAVPEPGRTVYAHLQYTF